MLDCAAARALLLEAEPAELESASDSELATHLAGCARCRAVARVIVAAERELGRALASATPRESTQEAARTAARRASRRRWAWRAAPLAAAAVLAGVLLGRREDIRQAAPPPGLSPAGSTIAVEAPAGRNVAVFRTANPDIVVIWFF